MNIQPNITNDKEARIANIEALREMGINPYPAQAYNASNTLTDVRSNSEKLIQQAENLKLVGRVTAIRNMGKVCFVDVRDDLDELQFFFSQRNLKERDWQVLNLLDLGDFIGCSGNLFKTKRDELSLRVSGLTVLGKALRFPPIGKRTADGYVHESLSDKGQLLRDRHVALLADKELRTRFVLRDQIMRAIRQYFHNEGFVEVETPILSPAYGGAAARPFVTKSESLSRDLYLRVSPECSLKRVLCGGFSKVFEIGKNFRNEGIDHSHNPEFTTIEWYEAYSDYIHQMERFEHLIAQIAYSLHGSYAIRSRGQMLNFEPPWPRLRIIEAVAEALEVGTDELTKDLMLKRWKTMGLIGNEPALWGELLMELFEELVEPKLVGPVFVIDHPVEVSPLTKRHRNDDRLVERFEPFAGGVEIGNSYSELNDPIEQRQRLVEQDLARDDPYGVDEYFLRAIDDGMPQAGGAGLGIDRLVMILTNAKRLSDVLLFPAG